MTKVIPLTKESQLPLPKLPSNLARQKNISVNNTANHNLLKHMLKLARMDGKKRTCHITLAATTQQKSSLQAHNNNQNIDLGVDEG